ncbi:uncharacterized protein LOC106079382 [Biomphalaria glabrata]|uniref:Uncharacterized protein LOC106079382 n=1 Tax=Biomphalaria glabrata TaxID=6526 RepID=A0A9W2ZG05_BIOGL|nr:uncharacterized protein LOC106079382 [Biomphalaria glabrata]
MIIGVPVFCFLMSQVQVLSAVSTTEGKQFLISAPPFPRDVNSANIFKIILKVQSRYTTVVVLTARSTWTSDVKSNRHVSLTPLVPDQFEVDTFLRPANPSGLRWCLVLSSQKRFVLLVEIVTGRSTSETFTAVPVEGWGKAYVVVTLEKHYFVVIISAEPDNLIKLTLNSNDHNVSLRISELTYKHGDSFSIRLSLSDQAYVISSCETNSLDSPITGSRLLGKKPFGVTVGNCMYRSQVQRCKPVPGKEDLEHISFTAEMLLPVETFGKHFILFNVRGRNSTGVHIITSGYELSTAILAGLNPKPVTYQRYHIVGLGSSLMLQSDFRWLQATHPVQVVYAQMSSCFGGGGLESNMMLLTPVELFLDMYDCIFPSVGDSHYLTLVVPTKHRDTFKYIHHGDQPIDPIIRQIDERYPVVAWIGGLGHWQVVEYMVRRKSSFTIYSLKTRFGCYIHGVSQQGSSLHSAGFVSSNIHSKYCRKTEASMTKGDLLDNDCDGWVDEDNANARNDDISRSRDDNNDEDLGKFYKPGETIETRYPGILGRAIEEPLKMFLSDHAVAELVSGDVNLTNVEEVDNTSETVVYNASLTKYFSEWTQWACGYDCAVGDRSRTRMCLTLNNTYGCVGSTSEMKPSDCYGNMCPPTDCLGKTFGDLCQHSCSKCVDSCNKFDGNCDRCASGYDFPKSGCQLDRTSYIDWNEWHCAENCKSPYLIRERFCKQYGTVGNTNNCTAPVTDKKPGNCYVGELCPAVCPDFSWAPGCTESCVNCNEPCDKFTGVCKKCKPGFHSPKLFCRIPCSINEYGFGCMGDCLKKCGKDCTERVHGTCPSTGSGLAIVIVILLICPSLFFVYMVIKRKKDEELKYIRSLSSVKSAKSQIHSQNPGVPLSRSKSQLSVRSQATENMERSRSEELLAAILVSEDSVEQKESVAIAMETNSELSTNSS